jgi:hypothetical protein
VTTAGRLVCLVTGLAAAFALAAAGPAAGEPYPFESWFDQDPTPVPARVPGNPLDYAGARIGLDVRGVELPRGWEGAYRFCCRFPIIDHVSTRPLYMKQWAEEQSESLVARQRRQGIGVVADALDLLRGAPGPRSADPVPEPPSFGDAGQVFTDKYRSALGRLCRAMADAFDSTAAVRRALGADAGYFLENPGRYLAPDGRRMAELTGDTDVQLEFIERARRVRFGPLFDAGAGVAAAVQAYVIATEGWAAADFFADTGAMHDVTGLDLPFGRVVVAGFGNDRHVEDAALLVDIGGNDRYLNSAGGTGRGGGVAVCIDHAGNDRYDAPDSSYGQGFGFLGVGMLIDLAGDDVYEAKHFAQGAGILGTGVLWDRAGSDSFSAHTFGQGAGMFGLGMLLDGSGRDVYDCASLGQGAATTLGLGIIADLEGNDEYRLACDAAKDALGGPAGYGQGGALSFRAYPWEKKLVAYGGVGLLVDDRGNDSYTSRGWCDQGGSYIMSLGALVDNEGDDRYTCNTGQGSGIHITNAILVDRKGDDVYEGGFRAGGSGSDRSPGFLIDYEGDDSYRSNTSSYGTGCKPLSYSLFIDYRGDDRYACARPESTVLMNDWHSFGGVWPESDPNLWPHAISLDLGGEDDYRVRNRANNSETGSFGHGIRLDLEWAGGDVIGKVDPPLGEQGGFALPARVRAGPYGRDIAALQDPDAFERFQAVGRLVQAGPAALPHLAAAIEQSSSRQFNRDALECLHYWFGQGKVGNRELPELLRLLRVPDTEVRILVADDLGLWKLAGAEDALVRAATGDTSAQVRRFALRSLLRLESKRGLASARRLATGDPAEDVRRLAVSYAGRVRDSVDVLPLFRLALAEDRASSVRCAAAEALGNLGDARGVEPLREAAKSVDGYLQRACGRALAELGQVEGIELLIGSLSFPSIDAFHNYDRNVPNFISAYCGVDLPEPDRYVRAKWQEWFDSHRDGIDLARNAAAFRALGAVSDAVRDSSGTVQAARYADLHERFPQNERVRKALAAKLNEVAWGMVTGAKSDVRTGLDYARRAVELDDDPNIWDTLIEAYLANGQAAQALVACRAALARHPDNRLLRERLRRCGGGE